jgi:hypothetical protein
MAIADIVGLLSEDNATVVLALLERGVIQDRRREPKPTRQENERRKSMASLH